MIHPTPCTCPICGSALRRIGKRSPRHSSTYPAFKVIRHIREKLSCRTCDTVIAARAPDHVMARSRAGAGLLAPIVICKYDDHLPLYRQAEIFARESVKLETPPCRAGSARPQARAGRRRSAVERSPTRPHVAERGALRPARPPWTRVLLSVRPFETFPGSARTAADLLRIGDRSLKVFLRSPMVLIGSRILCRREDVRRKTISFVGAANAVGQRVTPLLRRNSATAESYSDWLIGGSR